METEAPEPGDGEVELITSGGAAADAPGEVVVVGESAPDEDAPPPVEQEQEFDFDAHRQKALDAYQRIRP